MENTPPDLHALKKPSPYRVKVNSNRHSGPSQNRGPVQYLPTRKAVLINDYSFHIILKVIACMIKYDFLFNTSNINHQIVK